MLAIELAIERGLGLVPRVVLAISARCGPPWWLRQLEARAEERVQRRCYAALAAGGLIWRLFRHLVKL